MKAFFLKHYRALIVSACATSCLLMGSCSSATQKPPPPGMAVIDATPDDYYRDRIDGIRFVSVNGQKARGSLLKLQPGETRVRLRFDWPQGGKHEVDLEFEARPDTIYDVRYAVHPPYVGRLSQPGPLDDATGGIVDIAAQGGEGAFLFLPAIAAMGSAAVFTRASKEVSEQSKSAHYVDVRVAARNFSQGLVCNRRIYPDGRIVDR
jgi:hypothetical protein